MAERLKEPRKKWRSNQRASHPLPVLVESVTGIPAHLALWKTFQGRFMGDCVHVYNCGDISTLYNMGYFGKGSFSRSFPHCARKSIVPEMIRERQWKQRLDWAENQTKGNEVKQEVVGSSSAALTGNQRDSCDAEENNIKTNRKDYGPSSSENASTSEDCTESFKEESKIETKDLLDDSVLVISDTVPHCEDFISKLKPRLEKNPITSREVLVLSLEEAVFLNYGLGCLVVQDIQGERELSIKELWCLCQEAHPRFVERYVVYHYFRSKNWVVKSGIKFGGDFLLYKEGPGIYHASYVVLAKVVQGQNERLPTGSCMTWTSLMCMNRLAEASGKEVLICYVIWPSDLPYEVLPSPEVISKFKVHEAIMRRWQSSVARVSTVENKKNE